MSLNMQEGFVPVEEGYRVWYRSVGGGGAQETAAIPQPPSPQPRRVPVRSMRAERGEARTDKQMTRWNQLEQVIGPDHDMPYRFKLPLDPATLHAWQRLYQEYQEGQFGWELDPDDQRNL